MGVSRLTYPAALGAGEWEDNDFPGFIGELWSDSAGVITMLSDSPFSSFPPPSFSLSLWQ